MATVAIDKLTFEEFQELYGQSGCRYEFWDGEAREKGTPTLIHGLLQSIISRLLFNLGYVSASEVELRIVERYHPKPDIIASKRASTDRYPKTGWDIVVEIISEDDRYPNIKDHCRSYEAWGFGQVYLVDPSDRSVSEWRNGAALPSQALAGIPAQQIWEELEQALARLTQTGP